MSGLAVTFEVAAPRTPRKDRGGAVGRALTKRALDGHALIADSGLRRGAEQLADKVVVVVEDGAWSSNLLAEELGVEPAEAESRCQALPRAQVTLDREAFRDAAQQVTACLSPSPKMPPHRSGYRRCATKHGGARLNQRRPSTSCARQHRSPSSATSTRSSWPSTGRPARLGARLLGWSGHIGMTRRPSSGELAFEPSTLVFRMNVARKVHLSCYIHPKNARVRTTLRVTFI